MAAASTSASADSSKMLRAQRLGLCLCLALFLPLPAEAAPIETVQVEIRDAGGGTSEVLLARMGSSIKVVAEQLLLERDTFQIEVVRGDYERLLREVGDRVFTGYQVDKLQLRVDKHARVAVELSSWGKRINDVEVDLQFSGVASEASGYLLQRMPALEERIKHVVLGASVDSTDWAGGVLRQQLRKEVGQALPEFRAAVDLSSQNDKAVVQIVVYPVGQLVHNVTLELMSDNMPNILFMETRERFEQKSSSLRGLPVQYVKDNLAVLQAGLLEFLQKEKAVKLYGIVPGVVIKPGADTTVEVRLDSPNYKIWFEGYGDLGRDEQNISGTAHLGKYISGADEFFVEASVVFNPDKWEYAPGYMRKMGDMSVGYARRVTSHENNYRFEYKFAPRWRFRAEHFSSSDNNEFGVRYRIHEYLSTEYVYSKEKSYLRIVGNL